MRVQDCVCGQEIDAPHAAAGSEYDGQTYYFCPEDGQRQFKAQPEHCTSQRQH